MFGNMSPIFPFDTTPSNPDPFRLGLDADTNAASNAMQSNQNDTFNWASNDYNGTGDGNVPQTHSGVKTEPDGYPITPHGQSGAFDLNSAWAAWTASGSGQSGTPSNNTGVAVGTDSKPANVNSTNLASNGARAGMTANIPLAQNQVVNPMTNAQAQQNQNASQPDALGGMSAGPFAMAHPGKEGYRAGRATPSEVYRTVVKP